MARCSDGVVDPVCVFVGLCVSSYIFYLFFFSYFVCPLVYPSVTYSFCLFLAFLFTLFTYFLSFSLSLLFTLIYSLLSLFSFFITYSFSLLFSPLLLASYISSSFSLSLSQMTYLLIKSLTCNFSCLFSSSSSYLFKI